MDGLRWLIEALASGLDVRLDGSDLLITGPDRLAPLTHRVTQSKGVILPLLGSEDVWRRTALRAIMTVGARTARDALSAYFDARVHDGVVEAGLTPWEAERQACTAVLRLIHRCGEEDIAALQPPPMPAKDSRDQQGVP